LVVGSAEITTKKCKKRDKISKFYFKLIESKGVDTKKVVQSLWLFLLVFFNPILGEKRGKIKN
jgi:hypothetical protein